MGEKVFIYVATVQVAQEPQFCRRLTCGWVRLALQGARPTFRHVVPNNCRSQLGLGSQSIVRTGPAKMNTPRHTASSW
jgi:hypothetical protein